ncbi:MAG: LEA type 2 family protein [Proteobacteria bacterium]|jgi:LEA14-like dessication related protein|nr:LEA type 2 family protein [Pseudomonadota bacterium]
MRHPIRLRITLAAACAVLAACAGLPLAHPPHIDVVGVSLDRVVGPDAFFSIAVSVSNPDDREIAIDALDATLSIEGQKIAQAELKTPVHVPAHGSATAGMTAHAGMDAVLLAVAKAMQLGMRGGPAGTVPSLHYVIDGRARVNGSASVPFSKSGDVGKGTPQAPGAPLR